jgi:hypothetical protein
MDGLRWWWLVLLVGEEEEEEVWHEEATQDIFVVCGEDIFFLPTHNAWSGVEEFPSKCYKTKFIVVCETSPRHCIITR